MLIPFTEFAAAATARDRRRQRMEDAIERYLNRVQILVDRLNAMDPDPDLEGGRAEDDFYTHEPDGPGCPIADVDRGADDESEETYEGDHPAYGIDQSRGPIIASWEVPA